MSPSGQRRLVVVALFAMALLGARKNTQEPVGHALGQPGTLNDGQLVEALAATRTAVAGRSFITYGGFGGGSFQFGDDGRPRLVRMGDRVTEYTYLPARRCDGDALRGDLVIVWERGREWTATARESRELEALAPVFSLWTVDPSAVEDAGFAEVDGIRARGLSYPYEPPPTASYQARRQAMWFDLRTLMPLRHAIFIEAPEEMEYEYYFAFAPGLEIGPPPGTQAPDCVGRGSSGGGRARRRPASRADAEISGGDIGRNPK